jgi:hypothetical protein
MSIGGCQNRKSQEKRGKGRGKGKGRKGKIKEKQREEAARFGFTRVLYYNRPYVWKKR